MNMVITRLCVKFRHRTTRHFRDRPQTDKINSQIFSR